MCDIAAQNDRYLAFCHIPTSSQTRRRFEPSPCGRGQRVREYLPYHDCERSRLGHGPTRPHAPRPWFNAIQPPRAAFSSSPDSVTLLGRSMYLTDVRSISVVNVFVADLSIVCVW